MPINWSAWLLPLQIAAQEMQEQPTDITIKGSGLTGGDPIDNARLQCRPLASQVLEVPLDLTVRAPRAVAEGPEPPSFQPITPQIGAALAVEVGAVLGGA